MPVQTARDADPKAGEKLVLPLQRELAWLAGPSKRGKKRLSAYELARGRNY